MARSIDAAHQADMAAIQTIIDALAPLEKDGRERVLRTAMTFFGVPALKLASSPSQSGGGYVR